MMKRKQFIFVCDTSITKHMYDDLERDKRVIVLHGPCKELKSRLLKFIRRVHLNKRVNDIIRIPFKGIWSTSLRKIKWQKNIDYYVIFNDVSIHPISYKYLISLKKEYSVKYILLLQDQWRNIGGKISDCFYARKYVRNVDFDYIFTYNPEDVKEHGFLYQKQLYSILSDNICSEIDSDLYFCGRTKPERLSKLHSVYDYLNKNYVSMIYRISRVKKKDRKYDGILYKKEIPYRKTIQELKKCNCILEILTEGQSGASLRYFEAICYNKKLLTDNKNVVNLPFYDPRYMKVFEKPEDIDIEWVKRREEINYQYDGRFSPSRFIDKIIELEEEKKKEG